MTFIINPYAIASFDPDAQAFITAAGLTDPTQKEAVNQLVLDLKAASLWAKMIAAYPFVGGTAFTHKWNLMDPQDTDAAFRIVWAGGVTHDSNGITGNGTDAQGDTKIVPDTYLSQNDTGMSLYSRTKDSHGNDMGTTSSPYHVIAPKYSGDGNYYSYLSSVSFPIISNADGKGMYTASRSNASELNNYKNGSALGTNPYTAASSGLSTGSIYVLRAGVSFTTRNLAFAAVHTGLSAVEASNFNTAVQAFQTTLGRNV